MGFLDRFFQSRSEPTSKGQDTSNARQMGKEVGAAIGEMAVAFRDSRIAPLKQGYLDVFRHKQLPRIFDHPDVAPNQVLQIEYKVFTDQVDVLEPQLVQEASQFLKDWLSEELGVRDLVLATVQKMVHDEMVDLKLQGFQIMVDEGGGAILARQAKAENEPGT